MKNHEVLLIARSEKRIPVRAEDGEEAVTKALELWEKTDQIRFTNEDVTDVGAILSE